MNLSLVQHDPLTAIAAAQERIRLKKRGFARWYEVEVSPGVWVKAAGVTSVLKPLNKPGLVYWSANLQFDADILTAWDGAGKPFMDFAEFDGWFRSAAPSKKAHVTALREAADLGKGVHKLIEANLRERMGLEVEPFEVSDEARFVYTGFDEWAESVSLKPLLAESALASVQHKVAGTLDTVAFVLANDKPLLLDYKTSKKVYVEHKLQLTAYAKLMQEMCGVLPDRAVVRVPKDGSGIEMTAIEDDPEELWRVFLCLRSIYDWAKVNDLA